MTDLKPYPTVDDVKRMFGLDPENTGNRPRNWNIVDEAESAELATWSHITIPPGSLCVHTRDGASNPISPDACKLPNFIGTNQDDFDSTYRNYFYAPLADHPTAVDAALGGDAIKREISRMREVAANWRAPHLSQIEGPGDLKIYGGTIADDIDKWADMLAASLSKGEQGEAVAWLIEHDEFGKTLDFHALTDDDRKVGYSAKPLGVIGAAPPSLPEREELIDTGRSLKRIVEEIDGAMRHGCWRDEHGVRLKDTPEWVAFYNVLARLGHKPGGEG